MSPSPKPGILEIAPYQPGKARAAGFAAPIKLSANENPLGCSPAARAAYLAAADELHLYPDARTSLLRAAVAERFGLEPERLVFGAGSDEIFSMACQAYLGPGDSMVQPQFGFAAWAIAARAAGGLVLSAPERNYTVDVDAMLAAVEPSTKLMFIANPANPTGTYLPFSEIERLHASLPAQVLLVLDGAYAECARSRSDFADGLAWARDKANVLVTRTFSKLYGLAGLRIGWGYAPPAVAEALDRIRLPFSTPRPAERAAAAALADEAFLERSLALIERGRPRLTAVLAGLGCRVLPSAANFVTAEFAGVGLSAAAAAEALARRGVLVRRLDGYGLADWLRVTIGADEDNEALIGALCDACARR